MRVDMELQEAKEAVLRLMKDKEKIEAEIQALKEVLDTNNVGMTEPLVDSEGYPRNDIDVYRIRHTRHKIICLNNDHKALMKEIEAGLQKVHGLASGEANFDSAAGKMEDDVPQECSSLEPFLRVNFVFPGSPAELAGIQVEDLFLEFGSINYRNFKSLMDIAALVEHSRYKVVNVRIKRGTNILALSLTPRPWSGEGLLGCNVIPVGKMEDDVPQECPSSEPFLRVNSVHPGSPAELAGIQVEDLFLEFGSINYRNFKALKDIAALVEHSRYKVVNVRIKRGTNILALSLTPRPWSGEGLLGCNVIPVEDVER